MQPFKRMIRPSTCIGYTGTGREIPCEAYCFIEYDENGELSISGVIGPRNNGDCFGSAGQCIEEICAGKPINGWTAESLQKLLNIWKEWHLNNTRPYCIHQKELGYKDLAGKKVNKFNFILTHDARKKQIDLEKKLWQSVQEGKPFYPTKEDILTANRKYHTWIYSYDDSIVPPDPNNYIAPHEGSVYPPKEVGNLGITRAEEFKDGLLGRACPVCGYKYGTAWQKEKVPEEVLEWLFNLPNEFSNTCWDRR